LVNNGLLYDLMKSFLQDYDVCQLEWFDQIIIQRLSPKGERLFWV